MSKIYELAEQAAEYAVLNPEDSVLQSETEDAKIEIPKAFIDKFAELIIHHSVLVGNYAHDGGEYPGPMIKDFFGVEDA
jgi:hypothetical protein